MKEIKVTIFLSIGLFLTLEASSSSEAKVLNNEANDHRRLKIEIDGVLLIQELASGNYSPFYKVVGQIEKESRLVPAQDSLDADAKITRIINLENDKKTLCSHLIKVIVPNSNATFLTYRFALSKLALDFVESDDLIKKSILEQDNDGDKRKALTIRKSGIAAIQGLLSVKYAELLLELGKAETEERDFVRCAQLLEPYLLYLQTLKNGFWQQVKAYLTAHQASQDRLKELEELSSGLKTDLDNNYSVANKLTSADILKAEQMIDAEADPQEKLLISGVRKNCSDLQARLLNPMRKRVNSSNQDDDNDTDSKKLGEVMTFLDQTILLMMQRELTRKLARGSYVSGFKLAHDHRNKLDELMVLSSLLIKHAIEEAGGDCEAAILHEKSLSERLNKSVELFNTYIASLEKEIEQVEELKKSIENRLPKKYDEIKA